MLMSTSAEFHRDLLVRTIQLLDGIKLSQQVNKQSVDIHTFNVNLLVFSKDTVDIFIFQNPKYPQASNLLQIVE